MPHLLAPGTNDKGGHVASGQSMADAEPPPLFTQAMDPPMGVKGLTHVSKRVQEIVQATDIPIRWGSISIQCLLEKWVIHPPTHYDPGVHSGIVPTGARASISLRRCTRWLAVSLGRTSLQRRRSSRCTTSSSHGSQRMKPRPSTALEVRFLFDYLEATLHDIV